MSTRALRNRISRSHRAGLERRDACFISLLRVDEDDDVAAGGGGSGRTESGSGLETDRLQHRR